MVDTLAPKTIYKQRELDQSLTPSPVAESIMAPSKNVLSAAPKDKKVGTLLHTDQPDYTINKEEFFNRMANALKSDQSIAQEQEQTVKSSQETQDVKQTGEQVQKDVPQGLVMKPVEYAADGFNDKGMSGPILVGEQGAELVVPTGSGKLSIIDAATTAGLMTAPTHETIKGADDKDLDVTYQYTDRPSESIEQRRIYDEETGSVVGFAPPGEYGGITDVAKNVRPDLTKDKTLVPKKRPDINAANITAYKDESFINYIKTVENDKLLAGNMSFLTHDSPEGGNKTIGYGHKITDKEKLSGKVYGYDINNLTTEQVDKILQIDLEKSYKTLTDKYGNKFSNLDNRRKQMLLDFQFNLGGLEKFPKLTRAVFNNDEATMMREYQRSFTPEGKSTSEPLAGRNKNFNNFFFGGIPDTASLMGKPVKKAQDGMKNVDIGKPQKAGLTGFFDWLFPDYNKEPEPDPTSFETAPHDAPPKEQFDPKKIVDEDSGYGIDLDYYYDNKDEMAEYSIKQRKGQNYVPTPEELEKEKEDLSARFDAYWDMRSQEFDERDKEWAKEQYMEPDSGYIGDAEEKEKLLEEYGPDILPTV